MPPVVRRRRVVAVLALGALGAGIVVGATGGGDDGGRRAGGRAGRTATATAVRSEAARARRVVARMGLERQVGELLVIAFSGTTAPRYVRAALRDGRAAGVILFGANAPSAASVFALTAQLQRAAGGDAIVTLDQEGGTIRTLAFAPSATSQARQATPAQARAAAAATARALRVTGIDVVLGPVADVARGPVMAGRAYPGDAQAVAASVAAAVAAYRAAGVAPTLKHFPGLGAARANTDDASTTIARSRARLLADLRPFRVDTPLVMVGHARYPALDPAHIASQSHAIVTDLLRGTLGFDGVIITDSLEAQAALATTHGDVGAAAVRSIAAGVNLLLTTGRGSYLPVRRALLAKARRSPAFRTRVAQAAARVFALRATLH